MLEKTDREALSMKMEMGNGRLRIVGKAWQVRACLRQLASHSLTLSELLTRRGRARR